MKLIGIDSVISPVAKRKQSWDRLAQLVVPKHIQGGIHEVGLEEAIEVGRKILEGEIAGRTVVDVRR